MAVYIAFESELFPDCLPGFLELDRAFLLHSLATRLASLKTVPSLAAGFLQYSSSVTAAVLGQESALRVADQLAGLPVPWARFLWGPPGAGKTYGLGRLIFRLLLSSPNEQHLVVAPSNRSVDVALLEFLKHCKGVKYLEDLIGNRRVLRFGYPRISGGEDQPGGGRASEPLAGRRHDQDSAGPHAGGAHRRPADRHARRRGGPLHVSAGRR